MKPVNNGSQRRLFLRTSPSIHAQYLTARASYAAVLLAMYFLHIPFSTKNSLQMNASKQCYLFDGHAWTAAPPLLTYREHSGMVTYRGVLNRYSSTRSQRCRMRLRSGRQLMPRCTTGKLHENFLGGDARHVAGQVAAISCAFGQGDELFSSRYARS